MKKRLLSMFMVLLVVGGFGWYSLGEDKKPEPKPKSDPIMAKKLMHAQKILEGVTVKKFQLVEKHAKELVALSNRAEWLKLRTAEYKRHSEDFRRNAFRLAKTATAKNIDGVALGYVQLTMSCVNCHKYVREIRMAKLDD